MKYILTIILSFLSLALSARTEIDLQTDLLRLDSVVANNAVYSITKEQEIQTFKKIDTRSYTPRQQIDYYQQLYKMYLRFSPDSALVYIEKSIKIAETNMLSEELMRGHVYLAHLSVLKGDFDKLSKEMRQVKLIGQLPRDLQEKIAIINMERGIRLENFSKRNMKEWFLESKPLPLYWEQYGTFIPEDCWEYEYFKALLTHKGDIKVLLRYAANIQKPSVDAAMIYYAVACLYRHDGMEKEFLHYLILSACQDVMSANHEAHALLSILHQGIIAMDSRRALDYARLCADNARYYKDYNRSLPILETYDSIAEAYVNHRTHIIRWLVVALTIIIVAVIIIAMLLRSTLHKRRRLTQAVIQQTALNEHLQQMMREADKMQKDLQLAIESKQHEIENGNKYFLNVFQLVSQYLSNEEQNNKDIYNLLITGKMEKAKSLLKKGSIPDSVLKQLYEQFDKMFLMRHPDFVKRMNALLKPEEQLVMVDEQSLTPELRIYALVSIGITDSVSIAELLRYSTQTVYNYRLKMRRKAVIPENIFADTIKSFYS